MNGTGVQGRFCLRNVEIVEILAGSISIKVLRFTTLEAHLEASMYIRLRNFRWDSLTGVSPSFPETSR